MEPIATIKALASVIQLSVAPVFLLAGIAGLLNVLSQRLARVVDRARVIERRIPQAKNDKQRELLHAETSTLWTRIALVNWAIRLCVSSALVVCVVIVALFVGDFVSFNIAALVAILFVIAMLLIIVGLVFLLREISVATRHMRAGIEIALESSDPGQPTAGFARLSDCVGQRLVREPACDALAPWRHVERDEHHAEGRHPESEYRQNDAEHARNDEHETGERANPGRQLHRIPVERLQLGAPVDVAEALQATHAPTACSLGVTTEPRWHATACVISAPNSNISAT